MPLSCFVKRDTARTELFTKKQATYQNNQTKNNNKKTHPEYYFKKKKKHALGKALVFSKEIFHQNQKLWFWLKPRKRKKGWVPRGQIREGCSRYKFTEYQNTIFLSPYNSTIETINCFPQEKVLFPVYIWPRRAALFQLHETPPVAKLTSAAPWQSWLGAAAIPHLNLSWPKSLKAYTPHSSHTFCFSTVSLLNFTSQPHKSTEGKAKGAGITLQAAQARVCWAEQVTVPPVRATHATAKGKQQLLHISYLLNNLYPQVQFGSYTAGRLQQKTCAISQVL